MSQQISTRRGARLHAALALTLITVSAWLRGDRAVDDRGSDATEKAFMVVLAISIATAVALAATAFVSSKTSQFK